MCATRFLGLLVATLWLPIGCAAPPKPSRPKALVDTAVRIQSSAASGTGTLIARSPDIGAFILTAAHLVPKHDDVLVALPRSDGSSDWRTAWRLRVDRAVDLALLWVRVADRGPRWFLGWASVDDGPATILLRPPGRPAASIPVQVVAPGRFRTPEALTQGMSGAGVFHDGAIAGVLYGLRVSPPPPEGRFVPREAVEAFLGERFAFLLEGRDPEPGR